MNLNELTELLVESSENFNRTRHLPWWEESGENWEYEGFDEKTAAEAEACLAECGSGALLSPVGRAGLTLFHLLVWHNFYGAVKGLLEDGRITGTDVDLPDHKGQGLTPFLLACCQGNLAMVRLLLEHGANAGASDKRNMNAFHFLAYPRFENDVPAVDFTCLENSVEQRGGIARLLSCDINQRNHRGLTPLEQLLSTEYSSGYTWPLAEIFLEKGARTDYVDENGSTLLMMARRNGHVTASLALIERCPEMINTADKRGMTPIQHAVEYRNEAMYLVLKEHGASPVPPMELYPLEQIADNCFGDVCPDNRDALSLALRMTEKLIRQLDPDDEDELGEIAEILHSALASDRDASILDACREVGIDLTAAIHYHGDKLCLRDECLRVSRSMSVLKKLRELGVDLDSAVVDGQTPANILASMRRGRDSGAEAFYGEAAKLFSRESMEETDRNGEAAVHKAAENNHEEMLKVMIEKGVDINLTRDMPGGDGMTPLHLACLNGCPGVIRLLMEAGADDRAKTLKGETPAHLALKAKQNGRDLPAEEKAGLLRCLKHLDLADENGRTPLMLIECQTEALLPLFLERGVDVNHTDNQGMTALMLNPDKDMTKELIRAGADIHMVDSQGNTALHYTLLDGNEENARYLIRKGADYNRPNNRGETPAQIAVENGMDTVLELMTDIV